MCVFEAPLGSGQLPENAINTVHARQKRCRGEGATTAHETPDDCCFRTTPTTHCEIMQQRQIEAGSVRLTMIAREVIPRAVESHMSQRATR
jgi:hypothetical protein